MLLAFRSPHGHDIDDGIEIGGAYDIEPSQFFTAVQSQQHDFKRPFRGLVVKIDLSGLPANEIVGTHKIMIREHLEQHEFPFSQTQAVICKKGDLSPDLGIVGVVGQDQEDSVAPSVGRQFL